MSQQAQPLLNIDANGFQRRFDRECFGFTHNLHTLELFGFPSLEELAERYEPHPQEYFVAASASAAGTQFTTVQHGQFSAPEALRHLNSQPVRVLLKRPENRDPRFRRLLDQLFEQVVTARRGMGKEQLKNLESAIFITSASSITPFHFDPEIAFFTQIAGRKTYHVYSPESMSEVELERFYRGNIRSIAEVDLPSRDPKLEHVYELLPGHGHHQPQDSPHWVETGAEISVSYSFVMETNVSRQRGRARAANYFLRRAGLDPARPGTYPMRDAAKARAIRVALSAGHRLKRLVRGS